MFNRACAVRTIPTYFNANYDEQTRQADKKRGDALPTWDNHDKQVLRAKLGRLDCSARATKSSTQHVQYLMASVPTSLTVSIVFLNLTLGSASSHSFSAVLCLRLGESLSPRWILLSVVLRLSLVWAA